MRLPLLVLSYLIVFNVSVQADQPRVNIGMSLSLTGQYAQMGIMQKKGYDLWQQIVNDKGGLLGKSVNLIIVDDQSSPDNAKAIYTDLIEKSRVDLLFGPYSSGISEAIMPVAEMHKYPTLLAGASADRIWKKNYRYAFGVSPPASKYTVGFLQLLVRHKLKRLAVIHADDAFSLSLAKSTEKWSKRLALEIVYFKGFKEGTSDLSAYAKDIAMSEPESVVICGHLNESVEMKKAFKKINWYPQAFYASVGPSLNEFKDILGQDADLTFSSSYWENDVSSKYLFGREFVQLFTQKYHHQPSYHAANAYAAGMIIEQAVEKTISLNREKLRYILSTMDTLTLTGRYGVDKTGKQIRRFPMIIQWQNGKKRVVWPKEIQTADPIFNR